MLRAVLGPNRLFAALQRFSAMLATHDLKRIVGGTVPPPVVRIYRRGLRSRILSKPRLISVKRASIIGSNSQSVKM